ncbi:amino acid adenylation domain-containing protein [Streptomyces sp. UNOB3_S3]|uniref:amino acid adenylation domain-containing protein n=1 Tax=Streptomyces sp. UNOB3_S3 TaxID=2871682 RepID=UPI001E3DFE06|nr:amino acid adenylation domain-containing protein [Streptomyces sp. UNOB3_S3]
MRSFPERDALSDGTQRFSYRRLDDWSDTIGSLLRAQGVRPGDRVALRMSPGAEAVAAMIGILKAGAAYVPLDLRHPSSRKNFIIADSGATTIVGDPGEDIADTAITTVITTAEIAELAGRPPERLSGPGPDPQATAYVIYTSGTTGAPKGVPVRHHHAAALFTAARTVFEFDERDRWLLFHSIAFDFSVWEIWGAFTTGAELVVLPHWAARTPDKYLGVIADQGITVLNQTPTAFVTLAEAALRSGRDMPALRYVIFGGEKLAPAALRPWAKRYGLAGPRLVNGYGITETTVFTTFHEVGEDDLVSDESVIGAALPGFELRVVDESGQDVPDGETGELWLAGPQVTDGYLNRPELTAEKFPLVTDPDTGESVRYYRSGDLVNRLPDGTLAYTGRADLQVKLRGYRIELSDIEAVVRRHEDVLDAVVQVRQFKAGDDRLVCAFVARDEDRHPTAADLRAHVKELLPAYMHPARYLRLPELPSTVNGKVDRAAVARSWNETAAT